MDLDLFIYLSEVFSEWILWHGSAQCSLDFVACQSELGSQLNKNLRE